MSCDCNRQPAVNPRCKCAGGKAPETPNVKGVVQFCDICDPCTKNVSTVKLCAFVVPTLEEGRYFRNSFIFNQEDDSTYYISDDRSEIPFGSRPKFIDDFDPTSSSFKSTTVYDLTNDAMYVYGPNGDYKTISMTAAPISSLEAGDGISLEIDGTSYTISVDDTIATTSALEGVNTQVTSNTNDIEGLDTRVGAAENNITTLQGDVSTAGGAASAAQETANDAKSIAENAQSSATSALEGLTGKQDTLSAGNNITISDNIISATDTTYTAATASVNGLMTSTDRSQLVNEGTYSPSTLTTPTATTLAINFDHYTSDASGSLYSSASESVTLPAATTTDAGVMSAADKTKLDGIDMSTKQDTLTAGNNITIQNNVISATGGGGSTITMTSTDPGEGAPLAADQFIGVYQ